MKTFLMPLNAEEEKFYLEKMKEGSLEAKNTLIERNLRLVAHISRKYQNGEEDMEDLISIGTIGLIKAIATFNYGRGNRLATYAARCIDNELLMYFRGKKKFLEQYDDIWDDPIVPCRAGFSESVGQGPMRAPRAPKWGGWEATAKRTSEKCPP